MTIAVNSLEELVFAGANPAAQNVNCVAGCATCVWISAYGGGGITVTSLTLNGTAPDFSASVAGTGGESTEYEAVWLAPGSGALALDPAFSEAPSEGPLCHVAHMSYSGTLSVVDGDCDSVEGGPVTATATSSSIATDFAIAHAQVFGASAPTIGGAGASAIVGSEQSNNSETGTLFTLTAGNPSTTATSAQDYPTVGLIILRETGGAPAATFTPGMALPFAHNF